VRLGKTHVSVAEAAEFLGVSQARVYGLVSEKRLGSVWDYGRRWIPLRDLRRYAGERKAYLEGERSRVAKAPCSQSTG